MYLELYRRKWNIIIIGHPGLFGVLNGKTAYNTYLIQCTGITLDTMVTLDIIAQVHQN
jgi:hypothetical protein